MFPACAGMNRGPAGVMPDPHRVPRVRGDEPLARSIHDRALDVFPACAGMNRIERIVKVSSKGVPRVRGDEPSSFAASWVISTCSPRARG